MLTVLIWLACIILGFYILTFVVVAVLMLSTDWPEISKARKARKARHKELMRKD
jgi:hypothetical protein